ncbi:NADPH-dependent FMN reductase [Saccharothrix obliqua]|uniref:NADPH-dependent FMN reductase n=1 Tax=Saccharothrix obliqua TaxID=2861747 RepID=UPI001C602D13|nr:NAD(P)H-dependent oxidoreductase [Saccharothrix obliqua]MBW4718299.1 NAD(P)H-dependent oxidoreductase [Saccharothrix obliqua]
MTSPLNLLVIVGSVRDTRFAPTAAAWFAEQARHHPDFAVEVLDLLDYPLPLVLPAPGQDPDPGTTRVRDALGARLAAADAFVVVTPEYNHAPPAVLKNAIDWFNTEWNAKPVGFVSYGGAGAGLRAVEHLRHVFAELHAMTVRESLSFTNVWNVFQDGAPRDGEDSALAAKVMLDRLSWWGETLRSARAERPYQR